ncbi:MAG: KilA-N domain-containing protein [Gammaproteobacteria bacterium]|nr:KilA-N domain-containing protein [Gammaproteobacteria bacterium]
MKAASLALDYQGLTVSFNEDGWINATAAAAHHGKRPVDWLALDSTQEYLATLCEISNCEKSSLLKTKAGRHHGGTWLHPRLAVLFARWLDARFAIWCDVQIEGLLARRHPHFDWKRQRHGASASFKVMNDALKLVRDEQGKATASHHYINEARLINGVLSGQFSALDRDRLSDADLSLLAHLEVRNSVLIGRGLPYQERKLILKQYAIDFRPSLPTLDAAV